jgi:hypothetical protein
MKRSKRTRSPALSVEVIEFMTEFARYLLAAGVSRNRFARIVELAYFHAASQQARFRNNRLNQSAVAAMTGLTRTRVRTLLRPGQGNVERTNDRLDRIVGTWASDAEYITSTFAPRRLRILGSSPSFSSLLQKVGGDIPLRSVLRELDRQGQISIDGQYVKLTRAAQRELESRSLRQLSRALSRVIQGTGIAIERAAPVRTVTMEMTFPALSGAGRILMQRRLTKMLKALVVDVEAAGAAVGLESPANVKKRKKRVSQARLLLLTHEKEI